MSALAAVLTTEASAPTASAPTRIALLGTGTVGRAVLARLASWDDTSRGTRLALAYVANSREAVRIASSPAPPSASDRHARIDGSFRALLPHGVWQQVRAPELAQVAEALAGEGACSQHTRIVIDATASDAVADAHAHWLAQGIHVVTACKLGAGTDLARWRAIRTARAHAGTCYGDSATVGAGLPLLRTLRDLQAGGDRIHAIAGALSGSLAWLFHHYDGMRPFSSLVRQARDAGYTEPDPRDDLSGEDVRRKLLILARSAGWALHAGAVQVDSLVPDELAALDRSQLDGALACLDGPLRARYAAAWKDGARLRFIGRLDARGAGVQARVGLEALAADDPLAGGAGTDNRVAIWSDRYPRQPLVIQGPGAGAEVTAAALLDDALRIAALRASRLLTTLPE